MAHSHNHENSQRIYKDAKQKQKRQTMLDSHQMDKSYGCQCHKPRCRFHTRDQFPAPTSWLAVPQMLEKSKTKWMHTSKHTNNKND